MDRPVFHRFRVLSVVVVISAAALLMLASVSAEAQAGRRLPRNPPPAPVPTPEPPAPVDADPWPEIEPSHRITIITDLPPSAYGTFTFPERVQKWITARLQTARLLEVRGARNGSLGDAETLAKRSEDLYVLFVKVDEDPLGNSRVGGTRATAGNVWIRFHLLEPKTGKAIRFGRADLKPELLRQSRLRRCDPTLRDADFLLLEASNEVAERVLGAFNMSFPRRECRPSF